MATYRIKRTDVKATLDKIAASPWRIFAARIVRRTDVYLRYPPPNMTESGTLVRCGDYCKVYADDSQIHPDRGHASIVYGPDGKRYDLREKPARRPGGKIILQKAGDTRTVSCCNYSRDRGNRSRHAPALTGKGRHYDPLGHDLFPLAGMYNDGVKLQPNGQRMAGRFGQWRPYTQLCMRGISEFHALGHKWIVTDPTQSEPIEYETETAYEYSRRHIVTASGMETSRWWPCDGRRRVSGDDGRYLRKPLTKT